MGERLDGWLRRRPVPVAAMIAGLFLLVASCVASVRAEASPFPDLEGTHFYAVTECGWLVGAYWFEAGSREIHVVHAIHSKEENERVLAARDRAFADGQVWIVRVPADECRKF